MRALLRRTATVSGVLALLLMTTATGALAAPGDGTGVTIDVGGMANKPSTSLVTILALTLLSLAPAILLSCTAFTKILVVLGLTRNALGLDDPLTDNISANVVGLFLGFVARFFLFRRFVFRDRQPDEVPDFFKVADGYLHIGASARTIEEPAPEEPRRTRTGESDPRSPSTGTG